MTTDLCGIVFHLVDNVDLVGATEKHLFIVDNQRREIGERGPNMEGLSYHQGASEGISYVDESTSLLSKDSGGGQPEEGKP